MIQVLGPHLGKDCRGQTLKYKRKTAPVIALKKQGKLGSIGLLKVLFLIA